MILSPEPPIDDAAAAGEAFARGPRSGRRGASGPGPRTGPKAGPRIPELLAGLKADAALLARQEAALAKHELTQSAKTLVRDAAGIIAGAVVLAVTGLLVMLTLGFGLAALWSLLDLPPVVSHFLGFLTATLIGLAAGGLLVALGVRHLRKVRLTPERTLATLKDLGGFSPDPADDFAPASDRVG